MKTNRRRKAAYETMIGPGKLEFDGALILIRWLDRRLAILNGKGAPGYSEIIGFEILEGKERYLPVFYKSQICLYFRYAIDNTLTLTPQKNTRDDESDDFALHE